MSVVIRLLLAGLMVEIANGEVVRLVGSDEPLREGRVEVFHNGIWGTVCDDDWDLRDANVVCRQLGFPGAVRAYETAFWGEGNGQIWMDEVKCTGNENSLTECDHNGWGDENCNHNEDAGVTCIDLVPSARLVGGQSRRQGLVQVYHNKSWSFVCADQWDERDADVACRMMGFNGSLAAFNDKEESAERKPIVWLNKMQCAGNESSLFSCDHSGVRSHDCEAKAVVICRPKVRLVGWGNVTSQGQVEEFYRGTWVPLRGDNYWDIKDANVVCRQLGFKGAVAAATSSDFRGEVSDRQKIFIKNVQCVGNETSLTQCNHLVSGRFLYSSMKKACVVCIPDFKNDLSTNLPTAETITELKVNQADGLSTNPRTDEIRDVTEAQSFRRAVVILSGFLSFFLVSWGFLVCYHWQHFQALRGNNRAKEQKDIEIFEENASRRLGGTEIPLYSEICIRASQDVAERHYQGLQCVNGSEVYQNVYPMKEEEKGIYANMGHASCDTYTEVSL